MQDSRGERMSGGYRRGQSVTVRNLGEILTALGADGKLEGLPFMPEMARFCGRTCRVYRRADRTCVEGHDGQRGMKGAVFLDGLRCDGSAHQGCQRGCLIFWKEEWLEPADERGRSTVAPAAEDAAAVAPLPTTRDERFYCQSTELAGATFPLPRGDLRYYLHDLRAGEVTPAKFLHFFWLKCVSFLWRRLFKREYCCAPAGQQTKTGSAELDLQHGELVEVKSMSEIRATLDSQGRNRGLSFEFEMRRFSGRRLRVLAPVQSIVVETSGKRAELSNTVVLEGAICQGTCANNCPRANYFYWREIWLKRVNRAEP
jgi:hypothetical protein